MDQFNGVMGFRAEFLLRAHMGIRSESVVALDSTIP